MSSNEKKSKNKCKITPKEVETLFFQNSNVKLIRFYRYVPYYAKILIVILMSCIIGTLSLFFIKNTGLYSMGISSITQGLSRFITSIMVINNVDGNIVSIVSDLIFWFFIVLINIPLLIFSYKKIGKKFTWLTIFYLITSSIFSFSLNQIPGIDHVLIFGDVCTSHEISNSVVYLTWSNNDVMKVVSLLFYTLMYPILSVVCYSIIYILGGSTAGSDIVSIYWFKKKLKSLSKIIFILNFIFLIIGYIIGSYFTIGIVSNDWGYQNFFGPNLVCSLFVSVIFSYFLNKLYPRYKMVSVKCIGESVNKINDKLNEVGYIHSRTLNEAIGSFSKKKIDTMEIYCFYFELGDLINTIRQIDNNIFIAINKDVEINGKMALYKFIE